jgi:type IV pilus assembly protein PilW
VTLVELMITLVITLFLVAAAAYVYLGTRETQRAVERNSSNRETGSFALELLGRDIMNAGFYPKIEVEPQPAGSAYRNYSASAYPPNNWTASSTVYLTGIFGCEGSQFDPVTATCGTTDETKPDSIVINYFTSDPASMGNQVGTRFDCTGADVANDAANSNNTRAFNGGGTPPSISVPNLPPGRPLFVSNRYALSDATAGVTNIDQQSISARSLICHGNGGTAGYQPLLLGVEDIQFSYAIFNNTDANALDARVPDRFYSAAEVSGMTDLVIDGATFSPWARIVAVRVCVMTQSMGAAPKIADKSGSERRYVNCKDKTVPQGAGDTSLHQRFVQTFGVRNNLTLTY